MAFQLRAEQIYEAATDGAVFDNLSQLLANALSARSGVIHWQHANDDHGEISYSGYFSEQQMEEFGRHFGDDDLWSAAVRAPGAVNRAWNCADLVSPRVYATSRIYNEWIRPAGDDTFHCLGAVLRAGPIVAEIGFHRGRSQPGFSAEEVSALDGQLGHLRQLIQIRYKLAAAARAEAGLARTVDAIGYAVFTLACDGRVLHHNKAAEALLRRGEALAVRDGRLQAVIPADQSALAAAIAQVADGSSAGALRVARRRGGHFALSLVSSPSETGRRIVAVVQDPDRSDTSLPARLRALYALTASETQIALALCDGASVAEIAAQRTTSVETVRNQVKAISAKLGCGRQSEIVGVIQRLPDLNLPARS